MHRVKARSHRGIKVAKGMRQSRAHFCSDPRTEADPAHLRSISCPSSLLSVDLRRETTKAAAGATVSSVRSSAPHKRWR